jgi:hypothetical protein
MKKKTQGRRLISLLKRRSYTGMQLQMTGISVCWWKRVVESLREDEELFHVKGYDGLLRYRVSSATRWTL